MRRNDQAQAQAQARGRHHTSRPNVDVRKVIHHLDSHQSVQLLIDTATIRYNPQIAANHHSVQTTKPTTRLTLHVLTSTATVPRLTNSPSRRHQQHANVHMAWWLHSRMACERKHLTDTSEIEGQGRMPKTLCNNLNQRLIQVAAHSLGKPTKGLKREGI